MAKYRPVTNKELKLLAEDESVYLGDIDTSLITDMSELFFSSERNNYSGIELWDVSHVIDMSYMFCNAYSFDQHIGNWNVSNVRNMYCMFADAKKFNQDISNWNVSNLKDMFAMFNGSPMEDNPPCWYKK